MQIKLNGNTHNLDEVTTVANLISELNLTGRLAVEINEEIVPRSLFAERKIKPGDIVEIVHAIGGG